MSLRAFVLYFRPTEGGIPHFWPSFLSACLTIHYLLCMALNMHLRLLFANKHVVVEYSGL